MIRKILLITLSLAILTAAIPASQLSAMAAYDMPYYITVDITNQITTVFRTADNAVLYQAICTTGAGTINAEGTPTGTYYLPYPTGEERQEWFYFRMYGSYAKWGTRIYKGILFHSILFRSKYDAFPTQKSIDELGTKASHGCVRLRVDDAKWIAQNCDSGTRVRVYFAKGRDDELRELLLDQSYTGLAGLNGLTYPQYLGMAEDENSLGRYSNGEKVLDLQNRLLSLGYFDGPITGVYTAATVRAVRALQSAGGFEATGVADPDFLSYVYSNDPPVGSLSVVSMGMSGPVVDQLQEGLSTLKLYNGPLDGVYDIEVEDAVHSFQDAFGYDYADVVSAQVQQAIVNEAAQLLNIFDGQDYTAEISASEYPAAIVTSDISVRLRTKPSASADYLIKLDAGQRMLVLASQNGWCQVRTGAREGFISSEYVTQYTYTNTTVTYTSTDGEIVFTLGLTPEEYVSGENVESIEDASLALMEGYFATVNTGTADVKMNLRAEPSKDSAIIAKLDDGTELKVLDIGEVWTKVEYESFSGYLLNEYVVVEKRETEGEAGAAESDDYNVTIHAVVNAQAGGAMLRDVDSPDGNIVTGYPNGTSVEVVSADDDWAFVRCEGTEGYILNSELQYNLTE